MRSTIRAVRMAVAVAAALSLACREDIMQGPPEPPEILPTPTPEIAGISPTGVRVGEGITLTISGSGFIPLSVVRVDGEDRATRFVSSSKLTTEIPPSDALTPRVLSVRVFNAGLDSSVTAASPILVYGQRDLLTAGVIADPRRERLYATIPSWSPESPNCLLVLDPESGATVSSLCLGSEPSILALSDDGQVLYVALDSTSTIVRIDTAMLTVEKEFPLSRHPSIDRYYADDLVVLPGSPHVVVVSRTYRRGIPANAGVVVIDDGIERVFGTTESNRVSAIEPSARPDVVFGYDKYTSSSFVGLRRLAIADSGIAVASTSYGLIRELGGTKVDILSEGGMIYSTSGSVVDGEAERRLADLEIIGPVCAIAGGDRILYASWRSAQLVAFDTRDFSEAGTLPLPPTPAMGPADLAYCGGNRVALRAVRSSLTHVINGSLLFFRAPLFAPTAP